MKRLLNTLYVTTQGAYLARERETVLVRSERQTRLRVPIHALDGIVCFGQVSMSPPLIGLCGERGVSVSLLSERGRFLGRWQGPVSGNVLLRRQQYRLADSQGSQARGQGAARRSWRPGPGRGGLAPGTGPDLPPGAGHGRRRARLRGRGLADLLRRLRPPHQGSRRGLCLSLAQPPPAPGQHQCPPFLPLHPPGPRRGLCP